MERKKKEEREMSREMDYFGTTVRLANETSLR